MKTLLVLLALSLYSPARADSMNKAGKRPKESTTPKFEKATFAGGCFWCTESSFEKYDGIKAVISGYTGGLVKNPSYQQVSSGTTGHRESVEITYDPKKISYADLLQILWRNINPTDPGGQFVDRGTQYTSAIFYHNKEQKKEAEKSIADLEKTKIFKKPIVTKLIAASTFYAAEEYHQDYYKKNPLRYHFYRYNSGRDQFCDKVWGDKREYHPHHSVMPVAEKQKYVIPSKAELKKKLTKMQYYVTQEDGTEPSFHNAYWNNHKEGIYVDVVSGEPLFSSKDKFDSGSGWPAFTKPISKDAAVLKKGNSLFFTRTEVRSRYANSHLGHVFKDGPPPTGLRYCIDSAALRFIPAKKKRGKK